MYKFKFERGSLKMKIPFNHLKLDALLEQADVDLIIATSKHNVRYLLGGYDYFFFSNQEALGLARYLPVVGYQKGNVDNAFYIGAGNEAWQQEITPVWTPIVKHESWSSEASAMALAEMIKKLGLEKGTIAIELSFFPGSALMVLNRELPSLKIVEAVTTFEELRLIKTPEEINYIRNASEAIVDSILATYRFAQPGMTEADLVENVRREQTNRGLKFDYCLINSGTGFGRAPSLRKLEEGDMITLDSAGYYKGYLGDMARMGIMGEPTEQMKELLGVISEIQDVTRSIIAPGRRGSEIYAAADEYLKNCPYADQMQFVAHGMGLIAHEGPRLTGTGPVPYPGKHKEIPLEPGMIISVETHMHNPIGFVKLEDTLVVTEDGYEAFADYGRGWNQTGGKKNETITKEQITK